MAKVSVIVPTYNYGCFLEETIRSVLGQTFTDFELIIVDDGSTDNTGEVVGSFKDPRIKYIYQENRGLSAAENTGIKASRGEYIAILGADDIWPPENLAIKVERLDARPDIGLVCSDAWLFSHQTGAIIGRFWRDDPVHSFVDPERAAQQPLKEMLYQGCFVAPQTVLVRRTVFDEVGYFDESLLTHDDWDMFVRIIQRFSIEIIDKPMAKLRRHGNNMSTNDNKMRLGEAAVLLKAIRSYSLPEAELALVKRRLKMQTHFLFHEGHKAISNGQLDFARKALMYCIRENPRHLRAYVYLAYSLLGNKGARIAKTGKRWLASRVLRHQPSGNTPSTGQ